MAELKVGLLGASGETGSSVVNAMLESGGFDIVALTRPASIEKPANQALEQKGVEIRPLDTAGGREEMVKALTGLDCVISCIGPMEQLQQIPLVKAAKAAGVKRFLPCGFQPVIPPGGIHYFRDLKETVLNTTKQLGLPYTYIDVGWWYQIAYPRLPSGKIDYASGMIHIKPKIAGTGNQKWALTDVRDIGKLVALIVKDDRTLNKMVFIYDELWTTNEVYALLEQLSGEKITRNYFPAEDILAEIAEANKELGGSDPTFDRSTPEGWGLSLKKIHNEYLYSMGIRGDNTPEYAKYLGYLSTKDLYPDFQGVKFEDYLKEVLDGKAKPVYSDRGV